MSDEQSLERRSAQALLATYLQMTRYAELARHLQQARERVTARRKDKATDLGEVARLGRQLEAQASQALVIETALERLHGRASELAGFAEAGLTYEDFKELGLENIVSPEDVEAARRRAEARRAAESETPEDGSEPR
jgi:hypothetical protein